MNEEVDPSAAIVADALEELQNGFLGELDLLGEHGPQGGRKFLRCRPNFEIGQGQLYNMQVGYFPGPAGRLKLGLEGLLGKPKRIVQGEAET